MKKLFSIIYLALISLTTLCAQPLTTKGVVDTSTIAETKARLPGGTTAWVKYLQRNLDASVASNEKAPPGNYPVRVQFIVDKEGNVTDVNPVSTPPLCKSCGPEAVRVIQNGPKWIPAMQDGKPVQYQAVQQITFQVGRDTVNFRSIPSGPPLIPFRNISLQEAIQAAGEAGKMLFAQFEVANCERCNETADVAFASKSLADAVKEKCIAIKIGVNSPDREEFIKNYNPASQLGTFFISPDSELLSHYARTSSRPGDYLVELEKAYLKITEGRVTLKELDEEWKANPQNFVAMEMNISRRQSFGWNTDSLLDVYASRLPADSLRSLRTIAFMAGTAPSLFSVSNGIMRRDRALFTQVWNSLPQAKRVDINRRVINKSLSRAIAAKNPLTAEAVARFTKGTYGPTPLEKAQQGYDKQVLNYYRGVKDTAKYLELAVAYYDKYVMTTDVQAVLRTDSINRAKALDTARSERVEDPQVKGRFITTRRISIVPQGSLVAAQLLQAAQSVYQFTEKKEYLQKAITWAVQAQALYRFADMEGVLPRLLYVQGDKLQAIALQKELIKKSQQIRGKSSVEQATLELMESGKQLTNRVAY